MTRPLSAPLLPRGWAPLLRWWSPTGVERVVGGVLVTWLGVLLGVLGAFLTPLRILGVLAPVSLVLAVAGNWLLMALAAEATRHRWGALAPGVAWLAVAVAASVRTREGDLVLISGNWVAVTYLFAGTLTIAVAAFHLVGGFPAGYQRMSR